MMKLIKNLQPIFVFVAITALLVGCSSDGNDDLVITDPDPSAFDGELLVTEANTADMRNVSVNASDIGENARIKVVFNTTTENMRRLYVTQSIAGTAAEPYDLGISQAVDNKKDGSLDLDGDSSNGFEFQILFEKPLLTDGTVVYKIWATTGRGDFRDISKRNAIGDDVVGTITIRYGSGVNTADGIKAITQTMLAAPLGDGNSESFISLFDGETHFINEGEETAALWDFGYYYGANGKASLASTANYPSNIVDIQALSGLASDQLNNFYIALSNLDFEAITTAADLNGIVQPTTERVTTLSEGNILEFVDQYGNKGVIRVVNITGTDGSNGSITIDIKVQI